MSELEQRIERLEAIEGVRELLSRYAFVVDSLPPSREMADMFTEEAVLINPGRHEGREAILEYYGGVIASLEWAQHHIVNSTVEVEATGRARHRGYFIALMSRGGRQLVVSGTYDDAVVRGEDGKWRFEEKGNDVRSVTALPTESEE